MRYAKQNEAKDNRGLNKKHRKIMEWSQGDSWRLLGSSSWMSYAPEGVKGTDDDDDDDDDDTALHPRRLVLQQCHALLLWSHIFAAVSCDYGYSTVADSCKYNNETLCLIIRQILHGLAQRHFILLGFCSLEVII
jgi:hypothetical protein